MFDFVLKGGNASQLEKDIGSDMFPANEHFFGLVNVSTFRLRYLHRDASKMTSCSFQFGNTCYSNSVLQALYFCKPFRDKILEYKSKNKRTKETLLTCLADLFYRLVKAWCLLHSFPSHNRKVQRYIEENIAFMISNK